MLSRSNFKANPACIEDIKYSSERGIGKADITPFTGEGWIKQKQNLILTGSTGTGKTYLAEAIGRRALGMGYQTVKIRYNRLFDEIHTARGTGVYSKYLEKIGKIQVLILDDFANGEISAKDMSDLVEIIEDMDGKAPIIITSQYPVSKWHQRFPDPTLADALCDRLIHGATKINLKGESMRKNREKST
jgi:DNA replication protein DnaC